MGVVVLCETIAVRLSWVLRCVLWVVDRSLDLLEREVTMNKPEKPKVRLTVPVRV